MNAILYAAKSTTDERGSIPTQLEDGRRTAEREGWEIAGEYSDEAASAWSGDRGSGLAEAMAHAERLDSAVLLVQHSDRLARGDGRTARHLGELYFWAVKAGVELRSVQDDSTFTNPLLTFAMGERNAEDSRRKSLAVKAGMVRLAESGRASGGPRNYGYRYDAGALVVVPDEAEIVSRIFDEFLAGRSLTRIARDLHRDEIRTVRGALWRTSTVGQILRNVTYLGQVRYDGETYDGEHEAIVDRDRFDRAQALLTSRPAKGRGRPPKGLHLFRGGMLRCECGEAMVPRTNGGYQMYYCNGRSKLGPEHCTMTTVRRVVVDDAVFRYFSRVGLDLEATRASLAEARDRKLSEVRALRDGAERDVRASEERLARVRRDYTDGAITAADWADLRADLEPERDAAAAKLEQLDRQHGEVEQWGELGDAEAETYRQLAEIRSAIAGEVQSAEGVDAVRAVLSRMFERFVLHRTIGAEIDVELLGREFWIEPVIAAQAVAGYDEELAPVLRREPLGQAGSGDVEKQLQGLPTYELFGPVEVGA